MVQRHPVHWFVVRFVRRQSDEFKNRHPGPTGVRVGKLSFRSHGVYAFGDAVCNFDQ